MPILTHEHIKHHANQPRTKTINHSHNTHSHSHEYERHDGTKGDYTVACNRTTAAASPASAQLKPRALHSEGSAPKA